MDYLAPPLNAVLQVQLKIKSGFSVRSAIQSYIRDFSDCPFAKKTSLWIFCVENGQAFKDPQLKKYPYRKIIFDIFLRGLEGEPILTVLQELEEELKIICLQDLEEQVQRLPFLTLAPLFLFQVPAFFLLFLGPLILELKDRLM